MSFESKMIKEGIEKVKMISDLTPGQYCDLMKISHEQATSKQLGGLQAEINSLIWWLERSGVLDNETDSQG